VSFVLDTNICSAHITSPSRTAHRFTQYSGRLYIPTVVLGELYTWAFQRSNPVALLRKLEKELLTEVQTLPFDDQCAYEFGRIRGALLKSGITVSSVDVQIAAVALVHDHTVATHNVSDFRRIPGLRIADWLAP
jgi:tRNA(fMet)-specific endonuclease VapC